MTESKLELTQDEMLAILRERVWHLHHMDLETYIEARRSGTLNRTPADAALEVFAGDFRTETAAGTRKKRIRSQESLPRDPADRDQVRKQHRGTLARSATR